MCTGYWHKDQTYFNEYCTRNLSLLFHNVYVHLINVGATQAVLLRWNLKLASNCLVVVSPSFEAYGSIQNTDRALTFCSYKLMYLKSHCSWKVLVKSSWPPWIGIRVHVLRLFFLETHGVTTVVVTSCIHLLFTTILKILAQLMERVYRETRW